MDVATVWERELFAGSLPDTRRIALRMAIVIGDGPAARMLLNLARCGLGGTQYDGWCPPHGRYRGIGAHPTGQRTAPWYQTGGRQKFSWVHIDDVVAAIRFIRDDDRLIGPINIASPSPSDNRFTFAHTDLEEALTDVYQSRAARSAATRTTTARSTSDVA